MAAKLKPLNEQVARAVANPGIGLVLAAAAAGAVLFFWSSRRGSAVAEESTAEEVEAHPS